MNLYDKHDHKAFCRDALAVQDAVNLRAIARLLVAAADFAADNKGGTQASYDDPAVILIVSKIESLVHSEWNDRLSNACAECERIVRGERQEDSRIANHIDGYDRDDLGESPDY